MEVAVFGYAYPGSVDYWDGNWLKARVRAKTEGFVADYPLMIRAEEVLAFLEELRLLYKDLRGEARFDTLEGQLYLSLKIVDALGYVEVRVEARHPIGTGAELDFGFVTDQTFLYGTLREVEEVANTFPVRGER